MEHKKVCDICVMTGKILSKEESIFVPMFGFDLFVCPKCWALLNQPSDARLSEIIDRVKSNSDSHR